jgi:glycosyltransferase involved in cell wall biosynthesis
VTGRARKRVAQVIWSLGLGGAEQLVIRIAASLDRTRFEPLIICLDGPGPFGAAATESGIDLLTIGKRGARDLRALVRLVRLLRRRHIDVVHTHLFGADFWGRIAARLAGTATVVTTAHNVDSWKKPTHLLVDRCLAPGTTRLVAVSEQVRQFYEERGIARGRWEVVYNGVEDSDPIARNRQALSALGIGVDEPTVGLIGRLVPAKRPDLFLDAVARAAQSVPRLRALVVGDGPLRPAAQKEARRLGVDGRAIFTGLRHDIPAILAGLDVLAFASEREGLSIAMLEAMAAAVPVVATAVGGTPELIESGVTGLLVPPGDPQAMADAILRVLEHRDEAGALAKAAQDRVRSRFTLRRMIKAYEDIYAGDSASPRWPAGGATGSRVGDG